MVKEVGHSTAEAYDPNITGFHGSFEMLEALRDAVNGTFHRSYSILISDHPLSHFNLVKVSILHRYVSVNNVLRTGRTRTHIRVVQRGNARAIDLQLYIKVSVDERPCNTGMPCLGPVAVMWLFADLRRSRNQ